MSTMDPIVFKDLHVAMSERERALAEALRKLMQFVPVGTAACHGDKCRLDWCESCYGEEHAALAEASKLEVWKEAEAALATPPASPSVCPHCELPAVLPEVCTPEVGAILERNIERDWGILNTGYEIGKKSASPSVCEWRLTSEPDFDTGEDVEFYDASCKSPTMASSEQLALWKYCPYCGKPLSLPTPEVQQ